MRKRVSQIVLLDLQQKISELSGLKLCENTTSLTQRSGKQLWFFFPPDFDENELIAKSDQEMKTFFLHILAFVYLITI